ncbi:MAG TPA: type II toxin-antitoxin system VapC family toxin [Amnibacterium sp.]|uniref:type II toxin-antitoxin system VapC family toxin n=1 Tax=Amnibacterium sp. TaxID=1872496 RepID=UPI002F95BC8E
MIVLDTNVVSEVMRPVPDPAVLEWMNAQQAGELYLTSMTTAELLYGVARLPSGRRREDLAEKVGRLVDELFEGRILPFDSAASIDSARIASARERAGNPIGSADAVIAATASSAGADLLATRNVSDFSGTGLSVVNPWSA